jgi:hypothetical protein
MLILQNEPNFPRFSLKIEDLPKKQTQNEPKRTQTYTAWAIWAMAESAFGRDVEFGGGLDGGAGFGDDSFFDIGDKLGTSTYFLREKNNKVAILLFVSCSAVSIRILSSACLGVAVI